VRKVGEAIIAASFLLIGCSSGPTSVPDVVGERLDVAEDKLADANLEYEEIGGGTFGVVDASAWIVCDQDPAAGTATSEPVKLIVDRECGAIGGSAGSESSSSGSKKPKTTGTTKQVVPNVVGLNLQAAQDRMQSAGFFNLHSYDVTGEASFQVVDRNWRVVEQTPAAGTEVGAGKYIDLGVVPR
jgi:beta-lactam-binding protein with PASTA domain